MTQITLTKTTTAKGFHIYSATINGASYKSEPTLRDYYAMTFLEASNGNLGRVNAYGRPDLLDKGLRPYTSDSPLIVATLDHVTDPEPEKALDTVDAPDMEIRTETQEIASQISPNTKNGLKYWGAVSVLASKIRKVQTRYTGEAVQEAQEALKTLKDVLPLVGTIEQTQSRLAIYEMELDHAIQKGHEARALQAEQYAKDQLFTNLRGEIHVGLAELRQSYTFEKAEKIQALINNLPAAMAHHWSPQQIQEVRGALSQELGKVEEAGLEEAQRNAWTVKSIN